MIQNVGSENGIICFQVPRVYSSYKNNEESNI